MQSYHMHWEPLPVLPLRMQAVFAVNTAIKQFKILRRNEINCYLFIRHYRTIAWSGTCILDVLFCLVPL